MSSSGPPLIAPKVHECVRRFSALCGLLPEAERVARPALVDQLGRLKIWAGNIGAFQELPLQSSLDYRLREAPKIVDQVIELLNDLNETLLEVSSIISGERPNRVNAITDGRTKDLTSGNDDDDDEDEASVLSDQSQPSSELEELLESSSDTITSLFKISVLVKSATTRDRYAKAAKAQGEPFDARFDISHVGHKFPLVHQTDWLEKRLGKAITQRRQYLRYCREHRDRLETQHKATDVTENAMYKQPMPVRKPVDEATKSQTQSLKPPSTFAITTASTLVVNSLQSLEEYPDEVQSQTSYATSVNEDESSDMLRVPRLPDEGVRGLPFECPYCWAPQLIRTRRAWKKHIFQDLKPYVCTFEECDLRMFADRSTWFSHELQVHRIEWCCPFCTHSPLLSLESFEDHLQNRHAQNFVKEQLSALGATCQRSVERIPPQACPFCDEWFVKLKDANPDLAGETLVVTPAQFQHHVGTHMEQLALFALPKDHGDAVESTGVAGGADNRSDSELGSRASYECYNNPPLHIAAYEGLEAEVFQLLKDGAKVNAPGHTWGNVLQAAVVGGHGSIVRLLLEYGAEVTLYGGPYGYYSLHTAMQSENIEIVRLLREAREKTELKSNKEVRRIYSDHEGGKQEAPEITKNRDISLDLETRYHVALRYPRASYTCPVCGEKCGDANQLWLQHAVSRHQLSLGITEPFELAEVRKHYTISAERLSHNQSQSAIRATGGSDMVLLIDSTRTISIRAEVWFQLLLPDDPALFSDIANVRSRLPRFIDVLAKSKLEAKAGRFSRRLPLERDLKLLLQNLGRSLEVLMLTLETVTTAVSNGQMRIKPPGDSNGFEWKCMYSLASEVYVGMDLLDSTLRKFPEPAPPPLPPPRHLDDLSADRDPGWEWGVEPAVTTQGRRTVLRNTKDTEGVEDPEEPQDHEDPQDSGDFELFEDSEGPENPENPSDYEPLVLREEAVKGRAILVDIRKHESETSTVSGMLEPEASGSTPTDSDWQDAKHTSSSTKPGILLCLHQNCEYQTKRQYDLDRHQKTHFPSQPGEKYDCPGRGCGRTGEHGFDRKDHLREHLRKVHAKELTKIRKFPATSIPSTYSVEKSQHPTLARPQSVVYPRSPIIEYPVYPVIAPSTRPSSRQTSHRERPIALPDEHPARDEDYYKMPPPPSRNNTKFRQETRPAMKHANTNGSISSAPSVEKSQSKVLQLADNADETGNTKDTEGAEDPKEPQDQEDPQDSRDFELFEDSEDPEIPENPSDFEDLEDLEAEVFRERILVDHIKFVIDKAIVIDSRVQMVHRSEASTSPDAITSIQQNLPQIINTLLKTQEQADLGTYTMFVEAPVANLVDKLPPILGNIERFFGSDEQRQARQSPDDPQAEEVQRVSEMIETILVGIRKHESEIPMVSGMLGPDLWDSWGSSKKEKKKKRSRNSSI